MWRHSLKPDTQWASGGGVVSGVDVTLKDWTGLKEEQSLLHVYLLCRGALV